MASLPKLENFLFTISTGITGFQLFDEYGIKSDELHYFINFCKSDNDLSVSAMGPCSSTRYNERIQKSLNNIVEEVKHFDLNENSKEKTEEVIKELSELHDLITQVYDVARDTVPF